MSEEPGEILQQNVQGLGAVRATLMRFEILLVRVNTIRNSFQLISPEQNDTEHRLNNTEVLSGILLHTILSTHFLEYLILFEYLLFTILS